MRATTGFNRAALRRQLPKQLQHGLFLAGQDQVRRDSLKGLQHKAMLARARVREG